MGGEPSMGRGGLRHLRLKMSVHFLIKKHAYSSQNMEVGFCYNFSKCCPIPIPTHFTLSHFLTTYKWQLFVNLKNIDDGLATTIPTRGKEKEVSMTDYFDLLLFHKCYSSDSGLKLWNWANWSPKWQFSWILCLLNANKNQDFLWFPRDVEPSSNALKYEIQWCLFHPCKANFTSKMVGHIICCIFQKRDLFLCCPPIFVDGEKIGHLLFFCLPRKERGLRGRATLYGISWSRRGKNKSSMHWKGPRLQEKK